MQRLLIGISLLSFISIFPLLSSEAGIDVQEIEYEVINETGLDDVSPDAYAKIEDFLSTKGWSQGVNKNTKTGKTFFISTGTGIISSDRDSKNFISSRQNAFDKAMLEAKKELTTFLEQEIGSTLSNERSSPSETREKERIERLTREGMALQAAKAQAESLSADAENYSESKGVLSLATAGIQAERLLNAEIDRELKNRGFDPDQPVEEQLIKKILESEKFKRAITAAAKARLVGVQAYRTFEIIPSSGRGEIGVIAIYSSRLEAVANSLFSGDSSIVPVGTPKESLKNQIPKNKTALITTFGTQVKRDETGQFAIVAYAQQGSRTKSKLSEKSAYKRAALVAKSQIRFFAGEIMAVRESLEQSENITEYADESSQTDFDESYSEHVNAVAKNLNISGIKTLFRWKTSHPLTGHVIIGVVVSWSASEMDFARETKKRLAKEPKRTKNIKNSSAADTLNDNESRGAGEAYDASGSSPDDDDF